MYEADVARAGFRGRAVAATPFFQAPEPVDAESHRHVWRALSARIEQELGRVVWASLVGSRRYNLHTAGSDYDYMVV